MRVYKIWKLPLIPFESHHEIQDDNMEPLVCYTKPNA